MDLDFDNVKKSALDKANTYCNKVLEHFLTSAETESSLKQAVSATLEPLYHGTPNNVLGNSSLDGYDPSSSIHELARSDIPTLERFLDTLVLQLSCRDLCKKLAALHCFAIISSNANSKIFLLLDIVSQPIIRHCIQKIEPISSRRHSILLECVAAELLRTWAARGCGPQTELAVAYLHRCGKLVELHPYSASVDGDTADPIDLLHEVPALKQSTARLAEALKNLHNAIDSIRGNSDAVLSVGVQASEPTALKNNDIGLNIAVADKYITHNDGCSESSFEWASEDSNISVSDVKPAHLQPQCAQMNTTSPPDNKEIEDGESWSSSSNVSCGSSTSVDYDMLERLETQQQHVKDSFFSPIINQTAVAQDCEDIVVLFRDQLVELQHLVDVARTHLRKVQSMTARITNPYTETTVSSNNILGLTDSATVTREATLSQHVINEAADFLLTINNFT